jgi:hypothetical protein
MRSLFQHTLSSCSQAYSVRARMSLSNASRSGGGGKDGRHHRQLPVQDVAGNTSTSTDVLRRIAGLFLK